MPQKPKSDYLKTSNIVETYRYFLCSIPNMFSSTFVGNLKVEKTIYTNSNYMVMGFAKLYITMLILLKKLFSFCASSTFGAA